MDIRRTDVLGEVGDALGGRIQADDEAQLARYHRALRGDDLELAALLREQLPERYRGRLEVATGPGSIRTEAEVPPTKGDPRLEIMDDATWAARIAGENEIRMRRGSSPDLARFEDATERHTLLPDISRRME